MPNAAPQQLTAVPVAQQPTTSVSTRTLWIKLASLALYMGYKTAIGF
jgi:hypothetical protein